MNLGFRVDHEVLFQNEGEKILGEWMPAPRLGAAWDITNDSKTLLSVNAGRYYDLNGNAFAEWGDTRSAYSYDYYVNSADGYQLRWSQGSEATPLVYCTEESIMAQPEEDQAALIEACGGLNTLKPYHMDKLVLSFQREILPLFALGVKGIISTTRDLPEDVNYDDYYWVITNPEEKRRDYRALEFTAERKFDDVWQLLASYTLSESMGTTPGQFETASGSSWGGDGNGVGVYADDVNDMDTRSEYFESGWGRYLNGLYGLGTSSDNAGWYGYLPYHSFHIIKVSGSYTLPFGTTLGAVYEFDSGHAWQKRGWVALYADYMAFPEGRGSRFMPAVHYIDLRAAHKFTFNNENTLEFTVDVFNVPDLSQAITYYENDNAMLGMTMYRQSPRSIRLGMKYTY